MNKGLLLFIFIGAAAIVGVLVYIGSANYRGYRKASHDISLGDVKILLNSTEMEVYVYNLTSDVYKEMNERRLEIPDISTFRIAGGICPWNNWYYSGYNKAVVDAMESGVIP